MTTFATPPTNGSADMRYAALGNEPSSDGLGGIVAPLALGERSALPGGLYSWCVMAVAAHLALLGWAYAGASLREMLALVAEMRTAQRDFFQHEFEIAIEAEKPKPPEPEPPPPPPEAPPEPVAVPQMKAAAPAKAPEKDPYDPPPAPAQATKVLTDDGPVDLTGQGFVTGDGTGPGYGQVSQQGTGNTPTYDRNARVGGVPGATGTGAPAPPPPPQGPDRSRPVGLAGGTAWNCPFPPEADADQIDSARVVVLVTVRPDGTPLSVKVSSDPGHGFGRQARICALSRRYTPALDRDGNPITTTSGPIGVTFNR